MASTLETCANTAARPGSPSAGDTVYQEDTKQIIVWDGSAWKAYDSSGAAVNDADITGLSPYTWLRGDAGIYTDASKSTVAAQGELVYTWADQAGSIDFTNSTESQRPQWIDNTAANNKAGVTMASDGLTHVGTSSTQMSMDDYTMFWVIWIGYASSSYYYKTSDNIFRVDASTHPKSTRTVTWGNNSVNYPFGNPGLVQPTDYYISPQIIAFRSDSTADTHAVWRNGGSANGTDSRGALAATDYLFKDGVTTYIGAGLAVANPFTWYDYLVFDDSLTNAQMDTCFSYFGTKYGITTTAVS